MKNNVIVGAVLAALVAGAAALGVYHRGGGEGGDAPVPLTLKASVAAAEVGRQFVVSVESPAKTVRLSASGAADVYRDSRGRSLAVTPRPGSSAITFSAFGTNKDGSSSDFSELSVPVGGGPSPAPVPGPLPGPGPQPGPSPAPPNVDPTLLASFRDALARDLEAGLGTKADVANLAEVYLTSAGLIRLEDPAIAPKTVGDVYSKTFAAAAAKGVPRLPALGALRKAITATMGPQESGVILTPALKADLSSKYERIGTAMKEASK